MSSRRRPSAICIKKIKGGKRAIDSMFIVLGLSYDYFSGVTPSTSTHGMWLCLYYFSNDCYLSVSVIEDLIFEQDREALLWQDGSWATVLYDHPPEFFRPASLEEKHNFFCRISKSLTNHLDFKIA
ncbi:hypothetical protein ACS0TY_007133 [Phlomoides rotata]